MRGEIMFGHYGYMCRLDQDIQRNAFLQAAKGRGKSSNRKKKTNMLKVSRKAKSRQIKRRR